MFKSYYVLTIFPSFLYKLLDLVDYESVVVVRSNHANGIDGLKGLKFCHPGLFYDRTQRWSERFLKHFERNVVPVDCQANSNITSAAELEALSLASHFGDSCRPGLWSNNIQEDAELSNLFFFCMCKKSYCNNLITFFLRKKVSIIMCSM